MQATKAVKNPRKQRKRLYNAPAHLRHKMVAAPLSSGLVSSRGAKTLPVRKGDTVRIVRGAFRAGRVRGVVVVRVEHRDEDDAAAEDR